jgi:chitinase
MHKKLCMLVLITIVVSTFFVVPAAGAVSAWAPNVSYKAGEQVTYANNLYECIQPHTSLTGWEPPNVPALWKLLSSAPTSTNTSVVPSATQAKTSTATATRTPAGVTVTPTKTYTPTRTPLPASPTATSGTGACTSPAWSSTAIYTLGMTVSYNSHEWKAQWWTQNEIPGTTGDWGVWRDQGACGGVQPTSTPIPPTKTNTPVGPTNTPVPTSIGGGLPERVFAAYADISFTSVQAAMQPTGQKYYALSFVLGNNGTCVPAWDGTHLMAENYYLGEISAVRAAGGDVIAVFGGANGSDMASVCTSVSSLQAAYQAVINQYQFKWIDLNVEGGMVEDTASVDRRNKAIKALQDANPNLKVSYTLPVLQTGLLQSALNLLSNAKSNGVRIDYVNVMTMNYGPSGIDMGQAAIDAATNTHNQMVGLGITTKIGITPMIGQNNTYGEIFDLGDADQLLAFARATSYVGWVSFWSLGRDNGGCPGQTTASASCSGITQGSYAFTTKFMVFP